MARVSYIHKIFVALSLGFTGASIVSCQMGKNESGVSEEAGDTIPMKYAQLLTIVKHGEEAGASGYEYADVIIENPWKQGSALHRYILIPKGKEGDETVSMLAKRSNARESSAARCTVDTVRTPIDNSVVFTSPHCQLMYELGAEDAIRGVCDLPYINIADIKKRAASSQTSSLAASSQTSSLVASSQTSSRKASSSNASSKGPIMDCGSSMAPDIERIIALKPQALLISPFENSGGYGKLDKLRIPIIETADYMETSPLGRAEWMKFYGMLFGEKVEDEKPSPSPAGQGRYVSCEVRSDSLFARIEKEYLSLKAQAAKFPKGLSVLTERKTGNVWYVPGGKSTIGVLLKDANARYIFEDDTHSGSLAMSPEQILAKGKQVDVWAFKYFEPQPLTRPQLLQEYKGYEALLAFNTRDIYECSTSSQPYFELTSFHPEILLREFIILAHQDCSFGKLRFYKRMDTPDDLPVWGKTEECH